MQSHNDIDPVQLMQLRQMMRSSYRSLKQTNMLEHFRPLQIPELKVFIRKYIQAFLYIAGSLIFIFSIIRTINRGPNESG